jgi:hypothetical protein
LTSALVWGEWSASRPGCFTPVESPPSGHPIGWLGPRTGLDDVERRILHLPGLELRPFGRPARSQSLYRLRYSGSPVHFNTAVKIWVFFGLLHTSTVIEFLTIFNELLVQYFPSASSAEEASVTAVPTIYFSTKVVPE